MYPHGYLYQGSLDCPATEPHSFCLELIDYRFEVSLRSQFNQHRDLVPFLQVYPQEAKDVLVGELVHDTSLNAGSAVHAPGIQLGSKVLVLQEHKVVAVDFLQSDLHCHSVGWRL